MSQKSVKDGPSQSYLKLCTNTYKTVADHGSNNNRKKVKNQNKCQFTMSEFQN